MLQQPLGRTLRATPFSTQWLERSREGRCFTSAAIFIFGLLGQPQRSTHLPQFLSKSLPPIYQLKIVLRHFSPLIWRRVLLPADTSIAQLHSIIQFAMGWQDRAPHRFRIFGTYYGVVRPGGMSFAADPHQIKLDHFRLRPGERFVYDYDPVDNWQHDVRLEQLLLPDQDKLYPLCIGGAGHCPPESCGGPSGYQQLIDAHYSWAAWEQLRQDLILVTTQLIEFYQGTRLDDDDLDYTAAWQRINECKANAPGTFSRRVVNLALRQLAETTPCNCGSK